MPIRFILLRCRCTTSSLRAWLPGSRYGWEGGACGGVSPAGRLSAGSLWPAHCGRSVRSRLVFGVARFKDGFIGKIATTIRTAARCSYNRRHTEFQYCIGVSLLYIGYMFKNVTPGSLRWLGAHPSRDKKQTRLKSVPSRVRPSSVRLPHSSGYH